MSLYSCWDLDFSLHGCCDPNQTRAAGILLGWHSTALPVFLPTDSGTKDCNSLQKLCLNSPICGHSPCEGLEKFAQAKWANCWRNGRNAFLQKPSWPVLPSSAGVVENTLILTKLQKPIELIFPSSQILSTRISNRQSKQESDGYVAGIAPLSWDPAQHKNRER